MIEDLFDGVPGMCKDYLLIACTRLYEICFVRLLDGRYQFSLHLMAVFCIFAPAQMFGFIISTNQSKATCTHFEDFWE